MHEQVKKLCISLAYCGPFRYCIKIAILRVSVVVCKIVTHPVMYSQNLLHLAHGAVGNSICYVAGIKNTLNPDVCRVYLTSFKISVVLVMHKECIWICSYCCRNIRVLCCITGCIKVLNCKDRTSVHHCKAAFPKAVVDIMGPELVFIIAISLIQIRIHICVGIISESFGILKQDVLTCMRSK